MRRPCNRLWVTLTLLFLMVWAAHARTPAVAAAVAQPAWLRAHLPAETALYVRIPSLWQLYAAPNGGQLHAAMTHPAHLAAIRQIREAFMSDPLLEQGEARWARVILAQVHGPVEFALQARDGVLIPGPGTKGAFALTLRDMGTISQLNALLAAQLPTPFQFAEDGQFVAPNLAMHYDPATGRVVGMVGIEASSEALTAWRTAAPGEPIFRASEARIDQSGHGAYVWMDLQAARPLLSLSGDADNPILQQAAAAAFGFGSVGGKGRLAMEFIAPDAPFMQFVPREQKRYAVRSAGKPTYAAAISLLYAPQEWQAFRAQLRTTLGDSAADKLDADLQGLRAALGIGVEDIFAALGPDLLVFSDRAGEFAAVRIRDARAWTQLQRTLQAMDGVSLETREGIHQLSWSGVPATPGEAAPGMFALAERIRQRSYWSVENDYLIFANTPQELRDRRTARADVDLGQWLRQERGAEAGHSLLMINGQTRAAARRTYYFGLGLLQLVADLSGATVDPLSFASADELGLPMDGSAGIGIEAAPDRLAVVLSYDATGADLLFAQGGGFGTLAATGILAAIALPAYQDYTARAQVAESLAASAAYKLAYTEHHLSTGAVPDAEALFGSDTELRYASVSVQNGLLMLRFHTAEPTHTRLRGHTLALGLQQDGQRWTCGRADAALEPDQFVGGEHPASGTDLPDNLLPSACK